MKRVIGLILFLFTIVLTLQNDLNQSQAQTAPSIYQLKWSPDGHYIAGASTFGLHIWDVQTQTLVVEVPITPDGDLPTGAKSVAWDSNNSKLYIGSAGGGIIYTYDLLNQALTPYQTAHEHGILALGVSSSYIVSGGGFEGGSYIWDHSLQPLSLPILENLYEGDEVKFNREGTKFIVITSAGAIIIDPAIPEASRFLQTRNIEDTVTTADWSPDDSRIVTGTYYGKIVFWDTSTFQMTDLWQPPLAWTFPEFYLAVQWNPAFDFIISADGSETIQIWSISTNELITTISNASKTVDWSPDGKQFVYAGAGISIIVQDTPVVISCDFEVAGNDYNALANAITAANNAQTPQTICIADDAEFLLNNQGSLSALPIITGNITITPAILGNISIKGNQATLTRDETADLFRLFEIAPGGSLTINNLTLSNGAVDAHGGAILNNGTLTINDSTLTDNYAHDSGGAIYNNGTLTLTNTTLHNNATYRAPDTGAAPLVGCEEAIYTTPTGTLTLIDSACTSPLP